MGRDGGATEGAPITQGRAMSKSMRLLTPLVRPLAFGRPSALRKIEHVAAQLVPDVAGHGGRAITDDHLA